MGKDKSTKKAGISDYPAYAIYRVVETILRLLPMEVVCVIGSALGQLAYFLMPRRRDIVLRNLRIAFGEQLGMDDITALARKTFRHSGLNLIASIPASIIDNDELRKRVDLVGLNHLHEVINQNKGCIFLLAHMGNWEILTQLKIIVPEIKSTASIYRPLNNPLLDRLIKRRRQSKGTTLYSRKDGFTKPITHLKTGGTLGCIADQSAGKHGMPVPFFGKLASMTTLPALLYRKTKSPIMPLSMCTLSPGKWRIVFHPPINVPEEHLKDTYQLTAQCAKAYEKIMHQSPADVLWMHNYWRGANRTALKIRGSTPRNINPGDLRFTTPFYLLAYIPDHLKTDTTEQIITYLRSCRPDFHITLVGEINPTAGSDHIITLDQGEPQHITANTIRKYQDSLPTPFDCAVDLSQDGRGRKLFDMSGIRKIFALENHPTPVSSGSEQQSTPYRQHLDAFISRISPPPASNSLPPTQPS